MRLRQGISFFIGLLDVNGIGVAIPAATASFDVLRSNPQYLSAGIHRKFNVLHGAVTIRSFLLVKDVGLPGHQLSLDPVRFFRGNPAFHDGSVLIKDLELRAGKRPVSPVGLGYFHPGHIVAHFHVVDGTVEG